MRASVGLARTIAKALFLRAADFAFSKKGGVKSVNASPLQISFAATSAPGNARDFGAMLAGEAGYLGFCASWTLLGRPRTEPSLERGEHPGVFGRHRHDACLLQALFGRRAEQRATELPLPARLP
jgi:hypothetical protein